MGLFFPMTGLFVPYFFSGAFFSEYLINNGLSVSTIEFNNSLCVVGLMYCKSPSLISIFLGGSNKFN